MSETEAPILPLVLLTGAAAPRVADHARTEHQLEVEAAAAILGAAGLERRRAVLGWFARNWTATPGTDSVELLRELRLGR